MARARATDTAEPANFVFQATVRKVRATTMPDEVPAGARTVVVRVDRVISAPDALADYAGQEVTVELPAGEKVKADEVRIFHTRGWVFGSGLAVRAVRHEPATAPAVAAMAARPGDPAGTRREREMVAQARAAALIVSGRVTAVRAPAEGPPTGPRAAAGGAAGAPATRISEHDPLWQEAVVEVETVHKGRAGTRQVVIRFPSSTDVRWYQAPKFQAGQEGVFLLHKEQIKAQGPPTRPAAAAAALSAAEFTALSPTDVQPLDELPRILLAVGADEG